MKVEITLYDQDKIRRIVTATADVSAAFRVFGEYREKRIQESIAGGTDPYGASYTPLTTAYLARKRRTYGDKPILVATGKTLKSHRTAFNVATQDFTESIGGNAVFHQLGLGRNPVRKYLPSPDQGLPVRDEAVLLRLMREQANEQANQVEAGRAYQAHKAIAWLRRFVGG